MKRKITAEFWLNEQDSYEPTGVSYRLSPGEEPLDLSDFLSENFGCSKLGFYGKDELKPLDHPVKLTITITKE